MSLLLKFSVICSAFWYLKVGRYASLRRIYRRIFPGGAHIIIRNDELHSMMSENHHKSFIDCIASCAWYASGSARLGFDRKGSIWNSLLSLTYASHIASWRVRTWIIERLVKQREILCVWKISKYGSHSSCLATANKKRYAHSCIVTLSKLIVAISDKKEMATCLTWSCLRHAHYLGFTQPL